MFNLRDTNLRKWSGKKDLCWLNEKSIYAVDQEKCEDEPWIGYYSGNASVSYIPLLYRYGASEIPLAFPLTASLDITNGIDPTDRVYELMVTSSGDFLPAPLFSGVSVG